jgi:hypothetical protein
LIFIVIIAIVGAPVYIQLKMRRTIAANQN